MRWVSSPDSKPKPDLVLETEEDLVEFFKDLTGESSSFSYAGFYIEIQYHGVAQSVLGSLFERLLQLRPRGTYIKVLLPRPLHADLLLKNVRRSKPGQPFENVFYWDAADKDGVMNFLQIEDA